MIKIKSMLFISLFTLNGCAVLESKKLFAACRVGDVATTIKADKLGGHEMNPIMRPFVNGAWFGVKYIKFITVQGLIVVGFWNYWGSIRQDLKPAINIISCSPIPNNIKVIHDQKIINHQRQQQTEYN